MTNAGFNINDESMVPEDKAPFLRIILYFTFHISDVNEEKRSLSRYLRPEYLRKLVGVQVADYEDALSWALEHPDYAYSELLPDIQFSNEECVRLLEVFLVHIRAL
jgi:hypothetical protein